MAYDIGPRIGIDGEKEFRDSINKITTEMKTLGTEMRLVTSEFDENADSQEALSKKNEVLGKQIEAQKKKLELLKDMLQKCSEKYGETDVKTMKWQQSVNQAQTDLNKFESELRDNTQQLEELESGLSDANEELENAGESAEKASDGFTVMKGAMADLAADGIEKIASGAKEMATQYTDASTKLQGQTGATAKEMEKYRDIMEDIYQGGYGDNLEDVADALAEVKKQAGDVDSKELKELTENALNLKDTFGYDVSESVKTAKQLMKQFGITGEEAYDLIVAGAQDGLDQNGNLLDIYNEYGPKFKKMGLSAKEMYAALKSGAKEGVFDIDKLGDAMNEFSIRVVDGSDTTKDAFDKMGLDADEMAKKFAAGGDTAKEAFLQTMQALNSIEDPLERNTAGVDLFGSMWEDTGGDALLALGNIEGGVENVEGAMKRLDEVNSDNLTNKLVTLGRKIESEVVYPLLEEAYPALEKTVDFISENLDTLVPIAETAATAIAAIFVVDKASDFIDSVKNLKDTVGSLNTVLAQNPIGLVAVGLTTVTGAVLAYNEAQQKEIEQTYGLNEAQKEQIEEHQALYEEYEKTKTAREQTLQGIENEFNYTKQLVDELATLVDENGRVKEGYNERVQFIIDEVERQTGIEINLTDGVIEKYGELMGTIDQVMEKKKAEAMLSAINEEYVEAIQKQTEAFDAYQEDMELVKQKEDELAEAVKRRNDAYAAYNEVAGGMNVVEQEKRWAAYEKEAAAVEVLRQDLESTATAYQQSQERYVGYMSTIQNYEGLSSAIISGDAQAIQNALLNLQNGFITAEIGTRDTLQNQVTTLESTYAKMQQVAAEGGGQVTQEQLDNMALMVERSKTELINYYNNYESGYNSIFTKTEEFNTKMATAESKLREETQRHNDAMNAINNHMVEGTAEYQKAMDKELSSHQETTEKIWNQIASGMSAAEANQLGSWIQMVADAEMHGAELDANTQGMVNSLIATLDSMPPETKKAMKNAISPMLEELKNSEPQLYRRSKITADSVINALLKTFDIHSPSRVTKGIYENVGQGAIEGMDAKSGEVETTARGLADIAIGAMQGAGLYDSAQGIGSYFAQGFIDGANSVSITGAVAGIAQRALNTMRRVLNEHSPSKETHEIGAYFSEGFAIGVEDEREKAIKAARELAGDSLDALGSEKLALKAMSEFDTKFQSRLASIGETMREAFKSPDLSVYENMSIDYAMLETVIRRAAGRGIYLDRRQLGRTLDEMGYVRV